jgi:nitronate monooxygenase
MIIDNRAEDIVYTKLFTGVHGNYLKGGIVNAGLDPENLPESDKTKMDFGTGSAKAKAWRDVWGAGQGAGGGGSGGQPSHPGTSRAVRGKVSFGLPRLMC